MTALVALLALAATPTSLNVAPVPKAAQVEGILVDFSPLSQAQADFGIEDSSGSFRFVGQAESGKKFNHLHFYSHTFGKEEDVRDWLFICVSDYLSVEKVGKTSIFIKGIKDEDGKVLPLTELTVNGKYWGFDIPKKCAPTVTRPSAKKMKD